MAKILVLAKSGFGKTTAYCGREKLGIKGLNPEETYVIQCIGRAVPNTNYKLTPSANISDLAKVATSGSYSDLKNIPTSFAPSSHDQASNTINAMTGYSKASTADAITTTDSLNTAIGKLEKALKRLHLG